MNLSDPARPRFTVHQYASMNSYEFIAPQKKQLLPDISGYLRRFKACFFAQDVCQGPGCYRPSFLLLTVLNAVGLASALALQARISHDQPVFDTLRERDAYYTNGIKMCKYSNVAQSCMQYAVEIKDKHEALEMNAASTADVVTLGLEALLGRISAMHCLPGAQFRVLACDKVSD